MASDTPILLRDNLRVTSGIDRTTYEQMWLVDNIDDWNDAAIETTVLDRVVAKNAVYPSNSAALVRVRDLRNYVNLPNGKVRAWVYVQYDTERRFGGGIEPLSTFASSDVYRVSVPCWSGDFSTHYVMRSFERDRTRLSATIQRIIAGTLSGGLRDSIHLQLGRPYYVRQGFIPYIFSGFTSARIAGNQTMLRFVFQSTGYFPRIQAGEVGNTVEIPALSYLNEWGVLKIGTSDTDPTIIPVARIRDLYVPASSSIQYIQDEVRAVDFNYIPTDEPGYAPQ